MKLFKYISVILIFTLTATACLSGCGTKRTGEDSDLIGEPNFDKKIEISIGTIAQIGIEDSLYDYITDKFNVEIDYRMLDYNAWTEQVNGMINGGAMIDLLEWDLRPSCCNISGIYRRGYTQVHSFKFTVFSQFKGSTG